MEAEMASSYMRVVVDAGNSTGSLVDVEAFTAGEAAEKDQLTADQQARAQDDFQRRVKRFNTVKRLKAQAAGGGAGAQLAADVLALWRIDPVDPDPPAPTSNTNP
jgi:hypothetical protein